MMHDPAVLDTVQVDYIVCSDARFAADLLTLSRAARTASVGDAHIAGLGEVVRRVTRRRELSPAELQQRREAALKSARKRKRMRNKGLREARKVAYTQYRERRRAETQALAARRKKAWPEVAKAARHARSELVAESLGFLGGDESVYTKPFVPMTYGATREWERERRRVRHRR